MSLLSYPKLRDSGLEWLGAVPEKWAVLPLRSFAKEDPNAFIDGDWIESPYITDEGVRLIQTGNIGIGKYKEQGFRYVSPDTFVKLRCTEVSPGDVLICRLAEPVGRACIAPELGFKCITSVDVCILKVAKEQSAKYLTYFLSSTPYLQFMDAVARGGTRQRVSRSFLGSVRTPVPSFPEQTQIARFLEHETAKIDALIREQERLIKLLQEKRQAVISHAVTKGLDPDVPMKDSEVEWLGEVPSHWKVVRLKHVKSQSPNAFVDGPFGSNLKSSHFVEEGDAYVIESNFATTGRLDKAKLKQISREHFQTIQRSEAAAGDIIIAKIGARYGMCSILPDLDKPTVVSGNSLKLTIDKNICDPVFVTFVLRYLRERGAIEDIVNMTAQPALSLGELNNLPFPLPPLAEQTELVISIEGRLGEFKKLSADCSQLIGFLKERRSALISAAVTGKIDVRNWQPPADENAFDEEVRQAGLEATA